VARLAAADDVIDNPGTLDAPRQQVRTPHQPYMEHATRAAG